MQNFKTMPLMQLLLLDFFQETSYTKGTNLEVNIQYIYDRTFRIIHKLKKKKKGKKWAQKATFLPLMLLKWQIKSLQLEGHQT